MQARGQLVSLLASVLGIVVLAVGIIVLIARAVAIAIITVIGIIVILVAIVIILVARVIVVVVLAVVVIITATAIGAVLAVIATGHSPKSADKCVEKLTISGRIAIVAVLVLVRVPIVPASSAIAPA